jgi:putative sterol carrier protein
MSSTDPGLQRIFDQLPESLKAEAARNVNLTIQYDLSGSHGGKWWARIANGKCTVGKGTVASPNVTMLADAGDYVMIRLGQLDPMEAYKQGRLRFKGKGSMSFAFKALSLFKRPSSGET